MEDKRRDAGNLTVASGEPQTAEPGSSRRRGAPKRKASGLNASNSFATPSKRATREKNSAFSPQIHNGPLTRARQGPSNLGPGASPAAGVKVEEKAPVVSQEVLEKEAERKAIEEWEALEASIEAEFEALRSRDSNAHVVPNHCGWFSWTKVHPLEERALPSFFNGKSQNRTPEMYMEIRNFLMKKFHGNPSVQLEVKDLSEIEVGDLDARQEVLEFLEYWGLINFHPFPPADSAMVDANGYETAQEDSLIEKLYRFERPEWCHPIAQKNNLATPAVMSGLFSESTFAEELVKPEGPAVEYHCNSCSADCSRKRYHCQKQADFDLCTECYSNGKFGSGMSASDFILMEPAELHGAGGGNWTDQETLLLLEALELYKENWNEIAEHVATKTKAQCILHFVQMPIEDSFLDCDDDVDATPKENLDTAINNDDSSVQKEVPETAESKASPVEGKAQTSSGETAKPEDASATKVEENSAKQDAKEDLKVDEDSLKPEAASEVKVTGDRDENLALRALREAFEALGYVSTPESPLSFAEVGNPVMALAGFLARLAGSDVATASACSSLKSLKFESPGMQLALKHCFILEDPPNHKKDPAGSQSVATEMANLDAQKDDKEEEDAKEKKDIAGSHSDPASEVDAGATKELDSPTEPVGQSDRKESLSSELPKDQASVAVKESSEVGKDGKEGETPNPSGGEKDVEMVTDSPSAVKSVESTKANSGSDPAESTKVSRSEDEGSKSLPTDKDETQHPDASVEHEPDNSRVQNGATENQQKDGNKESCDTADEKDDHNIDKIKRAAISTLSAAAVKAKILADYEEDQIRQLSVLLIEKQLHKLETKLAFFNEIENVTMRVREQLDRSRQRLYHERAQIIAARLGIPPSSSRVPPPMPPNRVQMNIGDLAPRAPTSMLPLRPPLARPMGSLPPNPKVGGLGSAPQSGQAYR
ncbi:SWI/SNF complex subunit SWI3D isoform X2 [Punica granatum]|uniref:SWI/SNF complex subunit SWI3D isoform X2 n=2 Tax=Punica granatum TaxID=22663 RepID=A0A6P8CMS0_PUNGR|nr:SWI/SNF complex subunit SWI3D isoform X2 [Punica granatum]